MNPTPYAGTIEPGNYYTDMPNADYHASKGISKSGLDLVHRSPAHYAYRPARHATRHMEIGTAIHTAMLEPERFDSEYMLLRDVKDRRASEYKQAVKVHGSERTLSGPESDKVIGMQQAVYANAAARDLLKADGWCELSGFSIDAETGQVCRHRFDKLTTDGIGVDVKKTQDASPEAFSRTIHRYRYHVQAAFYADCHERITGDRLTSFKIIAVEEEFPHGVKVYTLDDDALAIGRAEYREDLATYAACVSADDWPCYGDDDMLLSLPGYVIAQYEAELEDGGII